ncbi:DUF3611 family protein [Prochlorococcus sp. MIT 1223]|uniref:DUF3611 family protein n=1 Tax=Prochlorococcus sp. MIT 1223 TaxID=3096217 RepID=UPI002A74DD95|nr:DUF3611 family protein [Prochlorococcus sp. MIT 1223]
MADQLDFQLLSLGMRRMGWIRFWIQTALGVISAGILLFYNVGGNLGKGTLKAAGLSSGLSITTLSFFILLYSLWQGWLIVQKGRALSTPVRPSRGETSRLLKRGVIVDLIGLTLSVIGYQALAGALTVQAASQVSGFFGGAMINARSANVMPTFPITSIEMLSVLSNTQLLMAHLIGLIFSLWLLQRIYRT